MVDHVPDRRVVRNYHEHVVLAVCFLEFPNSVNDLRDVVPESRREKRVGHTSTTRSLQLVKCLAGAECPIDRRTAGMGLNR